MLATPTGRSKWGRGEENLFSYFLTHDPCSYSTVLLTSWYWFIHPRKKKKKGGRKEQEKRVLLSQRTARTAVSPSLPSQTQEGEEWWKQEMKGQERWIPPSHCTLPVPQAPASGSHSSQILRTEFCRAFSYHLRFSAHSRALRSDPENIISGKTELLEAFLPPAVRAREETILPSC